VEVDNGIQKLKSKYGDGDEDDNFNFISTTLAVSGVKKTPPSRYQ